MQRRRAVDGADKEQLNAHCVLAILLISANGVRTLRSNLPSGVRYPLNAPRDDMHKLNENLRLSVAK